MFRKRKSTNGNVKCCNYQYYIKMKVQSIIECKKICDNNVDNSSVNCYVLKKYKCRNTRTYVHMKCISGRRILQSTCK